MRANPLNKDWLGAPHRVDCRRIHTYNTLGGEKAVRLLMSTLVMLAMVTGMRSFLAHDNMQTHPSSLCVASTILGRLDHWAAMAPDRIAFRHIDDDSEQTISFKALRSRVSAFADVLLDTPEPRSPVLLMLPAGLDFIAAFLGCLAAGRLAVPVPRPRNARQVHATSAIAASAQPGLAIVDAALLDRAGKWFGNDCVLSRLEWLAATDVRHGTDAPPLSQAFAVSATETAYLQYTSGSTGRPQGVQISHGNIMANAMDIAAAMAVDASTISCSWLPHFHDMGLLAGILVPVYAGSSSILMSPMRFLARPRSWLETISTFGVHISGAPNFAYDLCASRLSPEARRGLDLSSWRLAFCGAEPVQARTMRTFATTFEDCGLRADALYPCYGLAEATLLVAGRHWRDDGAVDFNATSMAQGRAVTSQPGDKARTLVSCGRWAPQSSVAIVDEGGRACTEGQVGEIWVSGPGVAKGYHHDPVRSAEAFGWTCDGRDGSFLRTGDLGFVHRGELFIAGRAKDLIIVAGRNLHPSDLEETARRSAPELASCAIAAFGVQHDGEEEHLVMLVERPPRAGTDQSALLDAIRDAITQSCDVAPQVVMFVRHGTLPRTTSGKLKRREIQAGYLCGDFTTADQASEKAETASLSPPSNPPHQP